MQWLYDTYVAQDDEAFEYSDVHFSSYFHAADWEAFCVLCQPQTVSDWRGHQHSSSCVDNARLSSE